MAEQRKSIEALLEEAQETIDEIIKKELRVSLAPSDESPENQKALKLRQQVKTWFFEELLEQQRKPEIERPRSARDYAAVLTYHRCAQETIEGIIRKNVRVSLQPSDGSIENQNALHLCQEVKFLLFEKLLEQMTH